MILNNKERLKFLKKTALAFDSEVGDTYIMGVEESLAVIIKLLADNDVTLNPEEFYKEFNLLREEGKI